MKNDFREFYDENYILHSAMSNLSEEELMHGEWLNKFRRYVDKVKTASGKWRYIYPEDLKKAGEKIKRDVSYAARNLRSKVTGQNKTFNEKTSRDHHPWMYERQNKKAGRGMTYYNINRKLREQREQREQNEHTAYRANPNTDRRRSTFNGGRSIKYSPSEYSIVMNNQERLAKKKAKNDKYKQDYAEKQKKAARSATSRAQKAQIYGDYASKQKKAAASVASRAQKSSIYSNYAKKQTGKALSKARNDQLKDDRKGQTIINKRNAYTNIRKRKIRKAAEKKGIDTSKW